jgi:hypothetical protein
MQNVNTLQLTKAPHQGRAPFSAGEAVLLEQSLKLSTSDLDALLVGATDAFRAAAAAGVNAQVRLWSRDVSTSTACLTLLLTQGLAERVTAAGGTEAAVRAE